MAPELLFQEIDEMLETSKRDRIYQQSVYEQNAIFEIEKARRTRLQILLLDGKNEDLQFQLAQDDDRIDELEREREDLQSQLENESKILERAQVHLRANKREIDTLRAELSSLQAISVDSSKILNEKLALSRELFTLRPELEHLRAQAASNQSLLSEKLSLQRELSAVQVELETEKRAAQRAITKEGERSAADSKLECQLQNVQAELAKERRERQKIERDAQKAAAEFEGKKTVLESRLDAFRNKLRLTKEQLKELQSEAQGRTTSLTVPTASCLADATEQRPRNPRKRNISQVAEDTMIGTPGLEPAMKRGKRSSTVPGEKSTFSITPFLNRTGSVAPGSPQESPSRTQPSNKVPGERHLSADVQDISPSTKASRKATTKENASANMVVTKSSRINTKPARKTGSSKLASVPSLEQVAEGDEDQEGETDTQSKVTTGTEQSQTSADNDPNIVKKKRKLLGGGPGKTLFDDDEADAAKPDRGHLVGNRPFGAFGRTSLVFGAPKVGPRGKAAPTAGFGAFSPLKKDRKLASVLAG